jgi:hypothetical protein
MSFWKRVFGESGVRDSVIRTRLALEALDGRDVPSATIPIQPEGTGTVLTSPTGHEFNLSANDMWYVATVGTQDTFVAQGADGAIWLSTVDYTQRTFHATRLSGPDGYNPFASAELQTNFTPDASKPTVVWDPNAATVYTAPAGTTFPTGVSGNTTADANYISLPQVAIPTPASGTTQTTPTEPLPPVSIPDSPTSSAPTVTKLPGGGTVTQFPNGMTIIQYPGGTSITTLPGGTVITIGGPGTTVVVTPGTGPTTPPAQVQPPTGPTGPLPVPVMPKPKDPNTAPPPPPNPFQPGSPTAPPTVPTLPPFDPNK